MDPRGGGRSGETNRNQSAGSATPHVAPYPDLGAIGQFSTRIPIGHVSARQCVSNLVNWKIIDGFDEIWTLF